MTEPALAAYPAPAERFELGDGIVMRPFAEPDLPVVVATLNAELEHLRPFLPWANQPITHETQGEWLRGTLERWDQGAEFTYGIFRGDELLGACGLHTRRGAGVLEIGYWLREGEQGRGLMTAAARTLTEAAAAMDGVRRVDICCDRANSRSAAVPRRLGYTHVADEERPIEAPGETGVHMVWSLDV